MAGGRLGAGSAQPAGGWATGVPSPEHATAVNILLIAFLDCFCFF